MSIGFSYKLINKYHTCGKYFDSIVKARKCAISANRGAHFPHKVPILHYITYPTGEKDTLAIGYISTSPFTDQTYFTPYFGVKGDTYLVDKVGNRVKTVPLRSVQPSDWDF